MSIEGNFEKQNGTDWPSDYYECLSPVFLVSDVYNKSFQHYKRYLESGDTRELMTSILLGARRYLAEKFEFKELTVLEIKSFVEIAKKMVPIVNERDTAKISDDVSFGTEAVSHWLNENYGIDLMAEAANSDLLFMEEKERIGVIPARERKKDRQSQFVDYVRKVRDKALNQGN